MNKELEQQKLTKEEYEQVWKNTISDCAWNGMSFDDQFILNVEEKIMDKKLNEKLWWKIEMKNKLRRLAGTKMKNKDLIEKVEKLFEKYIKRIEERIEKIEGEK